MLFVVTPERVLVEGETGGVATDSDFRAYVGIAPDLFAANAGFGTFMTAFYKDQRFDRDAFLHQQNPFARRNVTAIVLEVPSEAIGKGKINAWATISLFGHAPEVQVSRWGLPMVTHLFLNDPSDQEVKEQFNASISSEDLERFAKSIADFAEKMTTYAGGKIKLTGFLIHGRIGIPKRPRVFRSDRPECQRCAGGSANLRNQAWGKLNLEQQLTETVGLFARAGWADGNHEEWDNTDIDRSAELGVSVKGKLWGRADDTVGIAGVVNGISSAHVAYLMLAAEVSSSATASCRIPGWSRSSRFTTATRFPPRRKSASTISSSPTPLTTLTAGQ